MGSLPREASGPEPARLKTLVAWTGPGGSCAVGLLSPGDLGHPAGTCCGKKASTRPCQGPGLIYGVLTLSVQERGQVHQHGLTQSYLCLCCHQTQGLSTIVCSSPFSSQGVAHTVPDPQKACHKC